MIIFVSSDPMTWKQPKHERIDGKMDDCEIDTSCHETETATNP